MHEERINFDPNPKFRGVKFDRSMNDVARIKEIEKKKAKKRITILRILSHKTHWKVTEKVLVNIYKSLVRFIIDYLAYLSYLIQDTNMETLERIQNLSYFIFAF